MFQAAAFTWSCDTTELPPDDSSFGAGSHMSFACCRSESARDSASFSLLTSSACLLAATRGSALDFACRMRRAMWGVRRAVLRMRRAILECA
eukprot:2583398-Rhodomonas_salina.3